MCGICGILEFGNSAIDRQILNNMTQSLRHRGPDDWGVYVSEQAGLGHTRLSIIDLSPTGRQPMSTEDGDSVVVVYNGEIYNFREIRRTLEAKAVQFRGHSDTEVVLQAYLQWGTKAFAMFEGMFALALWDTSKQQLYLARDRFGVKPLYYYCDRSGLVFGSEIKALLASGRIARQINWQALHEYLHYGTGLGANTLFEGIQKLPPGHFLTLDRQGLSKGQFASILDVEPVQDDFETATLKVRSLLEQAVEKHLVSDVPVGVFLSGGIDSSAITAFASKHYSGAIHTFSAGFDFDKGVNELPNARLVAEHCGTEHHELHIAGGDMPSVIEQLVRCHDAPFGDPANIPLYLLSRELGESYKVILQGDGGDEIFAGYPRYSRLNYERWLRFLASLALWTRALLPRQTVLYRSAKTLYALSQADPSLRMALLMSQEFIDYPPVQVLSSQVRAYLSSTDPFRRYRELYERLVHLDAVQRMLYTDSTIILPDTYFEKVDKATMAHGTEVRVPMVDNQLAAYAMGLPASYKVRGNQKKYVLRRALRGIVPATILDGPKQGFGVPIHYWLRTSLADYMREVLLDDSTLGSGLFDRTALVGCIAEHVSGRRNNGLLLYKLLNLALWHNFYLKSA